jgi:hypothetical protein
MSVVFDGNDKSRFILTGPFDTAHEDQYVHPVVNKFMVINGQVEEVKTVQVFEFIVEDVDDPDIYAADPLMAWERSDAGQWIMENALETPTWHAQQQPMTYGWRYIVTAKLTGPRMTEWLLKYG